MDAFDYDVIIVGSGVAGALCAWRLFNSPGVDPRRILILEAGHNRLDSSQRDEFHRLFLDDRSRRFWAGPYTKVAVRDFAPAPEKPDRPAEETYYDQNPAGPKSEVFKGYYLRMAGGSTWAWRGNTPRFVANDFRMRSLYGVGEDWPISYGDLEDHYLAAEKELGVSGDLREWAEIAGTKRTKPFPMPAIALSYGDQIMKRALDGTDLDGVKIRVRATPQARNSEDYDGRPACKGNSICIPLCPIGAKYDATVHLNKVIRAGVELRTGCVVTALGTAGDASQVHVVKYKNWRSADRTLERKVSAKVVVLAANAIETPKILLLSKGLRYASEETAAGRYLMDHVQQEVTAIHPEALYPFRGPQSLAGIEDFRDGQFRAKHAAFRMTVGNDGWGRKENPANSLDSLIDPSAGPPLFGRALREGIEKRISHMVRISYSCEVLPDPNNRVTLSDRVDGYGIRRPRLTFSLGDYTWEGLRRAYEVATRLFTRIPGITELAPAAFDDREFNTAAHIMGTCRMGTDQNSSVVNAYGRTHDYTNLYIVGSSVFTTGATGNPTLTLSTLTLRTADDIVGQLK